MLLFSPTTSSLIVFGKAFYSTMTSNGLSTERSVQMMIRVLVL
jgi:hypothetical protein